MHPNKIMTSPLFLKLAIRLAMNRDPEFDTFGVGVNFVSCEERVYSKANIIMAIFDGIGHLRQIEKMGMETGVMEFNYEHMPTEVKPLQEKSYFADLDESITEMPKDLVIFLSDGQYAKLVTQKQAGQESIFVDCVATQSSNMTLS